MFEVTMPQLGETVADGTVVHWFKNVGDVVARGEVLFEVSTDKVDTEIPAQHDAVLTSIVVAEGTTVDVGTVLAIIGGDGDELSGVEPVEPAALSAALASATARVSSATAKEHRQQLSPVVRRLLQEHGLDAAAVVGTGPKGRITREDVIAAAAAAPAPVPATGRSLLSPVVRRLMSEHDIDPETVAGTGPDGRITRRDVELAIADRPTSVTASDASPSLAPSAGDVVVPFTRIRRLTAEHMVRSKATSAHTLMVREIDYEHVEAVRRAHGRRFKEREGFTLTYLPFNALAAIEALRDFPHLNASVGDGQLIVHREVNLGIAVDLGDDGLVAPVIRESGALGLVGVARRIRALADQARSKKLTVDDMTGGTFTITNPGPFGTLITGAIINQPQVAILATDGVARKPVVLSSPTGEESIGIHSIGLVALTFDHRAVDGAYVARFLDRFNTILNSRDWASEL